MDIDTTEWFITSTQCRPILYYRSTCRPRQENNILRGISADYSIIGR